MTGFLAELGSKLADRWLSAVVLPGLLFVCTWWCAQALGYRHAVDWPVLSQRVDVAARQLHGDPAKGVLWAGLVLFAASLSGLAADAGAGLVNRIWVSSWPRWLVALRVGKARRADARAGTARLPRDLPGRLTVAGDRFRLLGRRIDAQYGLDVTLAWPRLWLLLPADAREPLRDASNRYRAATRTAAWSAGYVALGALSWPVAVAGATIYAAAHLRGRAASADLAVLIEAVVDLHHRELAKALAVELPSHGRFTRDEGGRINNRLGKGSAAY